MPPPTLQICLTCGNLGRDASGAKLPNPAAAQLAATLSAALQPQGVSVQLVRCLSLCEHPIAWGLRAGPESHAYAFAPAGSVEDILATVQLWQASPQGKFGKKLLPENLRATLRARLAPLNHEE